MDSEAGARTDVFGRTSLMLHERGEYLLTGFAWLYDFSLEGRDKTCRGMVGWAAVCKYS